MSKDGKISKVRELLQAAPQSYKDLMGKTGITKVTAFSLKYYFTKQGYGVVSAKNEAKEVTLHIVSIPQAKVEVAPVSMVETLVDPVPVITTKPRKIIEKVLAGKAAKKAK